MSNNLILNWEDMWWEWKHVYRHACPDVSVVLSSSFPQPTKCAEYIFQGCDGKVQYYLGKQQQCSLKSNWLFTYCTQQLEKSIKMQLKHQQLLIKPVNITTINNRNKENLLIYQAQYDFSRASPSLQELLLSARLCQALCWTLWSTSNKTEERTALLKIKTYKQETIDHSTRQHTIKCCLKYNQESGADIVVPL